MVNVYSNYAEETSCMKDLEREYISMKQYPECSQIATTCPGNRRLLILL